MSQNNPPNAVHGATDLAGSGYANYSASGIHGFGKQGSANLYAQGAGAKGLNVTVKRATAAAAESDGITLNITTAGAVAFAWSADRRELTGGVADGAALSVVKAGIDGITDAPFATAYFGPSGDPEDGTGIVADGGYLFGDQATFDVLAAGVRRGPGAGLRVTLARSYRKGVAGNGVVARVASGAALAVTAGASGVEIDVLATSTMALLKAAVDADASLSSAYFGGEEGTSLVPVGQVAQAHGGDWADVTTGGATADRPYTCELRMSNAAWVAVSPTQPADDAKSEYQTSNTGPWVRAVAPGNLVWVKRIGNADRAGSLAVWY